MNNKALFSQYNKTDTSCKESLTALGISMSDADIFLSQSRDSISIPAAQLLMRTEIKDALTEKSYSSLEQWVTYFKNSGLSSEEIANVMQNWHLHRGKVTVNGDFSIYSRYILGHLPSGIKEVTGYVYVGETGLTSLQNFPVCGADLELRDMERLTSLEGMQQEIYGDLSIIACHSLKSLYGIAQKVRKSLYLSDTWNLHSLHPLPKYIGGDLVLCSCGDYFNSFPNIDLGGKVILDDRQVRLQEILKEKNIPFEIRT